MTNKQLKQSLNNRLKSFDKIIKNIKNELNETNSTQKKKKLNDELQFQIGFFDGLKIALSDLEYKITRKNKYLLDR